MKLRYSHADRWMSAAESLVKLRSGMRVFIGSGCAAPQFLIEALTARWPEIYDVEVLHILTHGSALYARHDLLEHFRQNSFFIGGNVRDAVNEGVADYTPISLSSKSPDCFAKNGCILT